MGFPLDGQDKIILMFTKKIKRLSLLWNTEEGRVIVCTCYGVFGSGCLEPVQSWMKSLGDQCEANCFTGSLVPAAGHGSSQQDNDPNYKDKPPKNGSEKNTSLFWSVLMNPEFAQGPIKCHLQKILKQFPVDRCRRPNKSSRNCLNAGISSKGYAMKYEGHRRICLGLFHSFLLLFNDSFELRYW